MEETEIDLIEANQALLKAQEQSGDVKDAVNDPKFIVPWIDLGIKCLFMLFVWLMFRDVFVHMNLII